MLDDKAEVLAKVECRRGNTDRTEKVQENEISSNVLKMIETFRYISLNRKSHMFGKVEL